MGFLVNFGIGLGKSLDQSFDDKEAKRAEMVKYRMQTLEKGLDTFKASRAKAAELASQARSLAGISGISQKNIEALLNSKAVSPEDIIKGKVSVIQAAHEKQNPTVTKPAQEQPAIGASPFPSQKPEAPMGAPAEPMAAPQGMEDMGQVPQAPQVADPRAGMQKFADGTQGPTMQTLQQQGTALPNQQIDGMTNQQHQVGDKVWTSHEGQVIASGPASAPQEQGTMAWAGDRLRQGLFGRDIEGAGPEGDRMFMQANGMTPEQLQSMQSYSSPEYAMDEGSRVAFQSGEQFDPVKMLHAVKLEDIREGQGPTFYAAMKSQDWGTAMSLLYTSQEKQERMIAAARANAELSASAQRASGGQGQPSTLEKVNKYIESLPPGPERDRAIRMAEESKNTTFLERVQDFRVSAAANPVMTQAKQAKVLLQMSNEDRANGGTGFNEASEAELNALASGRNTE